MRITRLCGEAVVSFLSVLVLMQPVSFAGSPSSIDAVPGLSTALAQKAASGTLIRHISQKLSSAQTVRALPPVPSIITAIYAGEPPSESLAAALSMKGVIVYPGTWTPPSSHHPLGFYLARIPIAVLTDVLRLDAVKKMDSAESESVPMSNEAARAVKADLAWSMGVTGTGVRIGILDSGLDISYAGSELPASFPCRDYSGFPTIDTVVANTVTGHGTHVTGIALARGMFSLANSANGGGAYKGMAPGASLVFLKIGLDGSGAATDAAEIAAIHAAVDSFHVNLFNLSYGGWDAYHDGSNVVSQTIDWAFSRGVACFVAAGNMGNLARHASGYVLAHDTSDYIQVNTSTSLSQLGFNLVWWDGTYRNNLSLLYYDNAKQLLANVSYATTTESPRGTESQFSNYMLPGSSSSTVYYLRVVNPSPNIQSYHLYENVNAGTAVFAYPDPNSTITTPGDADEAFTVGAYVSRDSWTGSDGALHPTGITLNTLASFSSRGPRVDGALKPNLCAPGSVLVSLRDRNVYSTTTGFCVDDDGSAGGSADYYVMQGTSMASPVCAGAAALLYQQAPSMTPQQIYDALMHNAISDGYTGGIPNTSAGFGKLNVFASLQDLPLPVELTSFTASLLGRSVMLNWHTATETNNYGFTIERKQDPGIDGKRTAASNSVWTILGFIPGSGSSSAPRAYTYVDRLHSTGSYAYRLKQTDKDGRFTYSDEIGVDAATAPGEFSLEQNYPNPFNPTTNFRFSIPSQEPVRLSVSDVLGREIAVIVDRRMDAGTYSETWDASRFPSGVYFFTLSAGAMKETKKLLVQK